MLGDADDEQWLELIRPFYHAKDFRIAGERGTDILGALHTSRADQGHETVLPSVRNLTKTCGLIAASSSGRKHTMIYPKNTSKQTP